MTHVSNFQTWFDLILPFTPKPYRWLMRYSGVLQCLNLNTSTDSARVTEEVKNAWRRSSSGKYAFSLDAQMKCHQGTPVYYQEEWPEQFHVLNLSVTRHPFVNAINVEYWHQATRTPNMCA